jgi:hypothetical protein
MLVLKSVEVAENAFGASEPVCRDTSRSAGGAYGLEMV